MKELKKKKVKYVDERCEIGERVYWENLRGDHFEGILIEWDNYNAIVRLDDGTTKAVQC